MKHEIKLLRLALILFVLCCTSVTYAKISYDPILIISSYNPADRKTSQTISNFMEEFRELGGKRDIIIENMNCKSFSDVKTWKDTMLEILHKYEENEKPGLIILLGQEAFVSYISIEDSAVSDIPVRSEERRVGKEW